MPEQKLFPKFDNELRRRFYNLKTLEKDRIKLSFRNAQLINVRSGLLGISTPQPKDVVGIYANLLALNTQNSLLLNVPPKERIQASFSVQNTIALEVLFSSSSRATSWNRFDRQVPNLPRNYWLKRYSELGSAKTITSQGLRISFRDSTDAFVAV